MKNLTKLIMCILSFTLLVFSIQAITITSGTFYASGSNTSINVTEAINTTNVTVGSEYIYLENFQFNNSKEFWLNTTDFINSTETYDFNYTRENVLVDTGDFINYFRFNLTTNGTLLSDYVFGNFTINDTEAPIWFEHFGDEGTKTWLFEKFGYVSSLFSFDFLFSTTNNITFNISPSTITINVYDRETGVLINETVTLELIGSVGEINITNTGVGTFQTLNAEAGDYRIISTSANYETESIFFTFSNQENISLDIYMINSTSLNLGFVNVEVKDSLSFFVEGAIVDLLEWKSSLSSYVSVAQCKTTADGQCSLNVELNDKLYKFQASKSSIVKTTEAQIITTNGITIPITLQDTTLTAVSDLENVVAEFTETISGNVSTTRLQWSDTDGLVSQACITTYKDTGFTQQQIGQNCTSSSSGILFTTNNINNTFAIKIVGTITVGGTSYPIDVFKHNSIDDISFSLASNNLDIYVPIVFLLLAIAVGLFFGNIYIGLSLAIVLEWIATILAPSVISASIATVVTVIVLLTFWGLRKK